MAGRAARRPATLPWARPRHELVLLVLVAAAALSPVHRLNAQDWSRMCATDAYVHLRLTADACLGGRTGIGTIDRSRHGGHYYANKAPGMAALAIPAYEVMQLPPPRAWHVFDRRLWFVRAVTAGSFFVAGAFLVGRVAEGLVAGTGGPTLVTLALGTLAASFAAHDFDHVPAMTLGFAAFLLLWRRRPLAAGLAAGLALLVEYEQAVVLLALGAYAVSLGGNAALRYAAGVVPGGALVAAYDWAAFGAPWHNPLSYSDNVYEAEHRSGLLGIHLPNLHATRLVFVGDRGLLVAAPVLVLAGLGLVSLWRRGLRRETLVCGAVTVAFLVAECGYFIPYGGASPGPRFLIPALPFLAIGLPAAFARRPRLTTVAAAASITAQLALLLTWSNVQNGYPGTVWKQIGVSLRDGSHSLLVAKLVDSIFQVSGMSRDAAAALAAALAAAAFGLAIAPLYRR